MKAAAAVERANQSGRAPLRTILQSRSRRPPPLSRFGQKTERTWTARSLARARPCASRRPAAGAPPGCARPRARARHIAAAADAGGGWGWGCSVRNVPVSTSLWLARVPGVGGVVRTMCASSSRVSTSAKRRSSSSRAATSASRRWMPCSRRAASWPTVLRDARSSSTRVSWQTFPAGAARGAGASAPVTAAR